MVSWQDEVKWVYRKYAEEKDRNGQRLGVIHWCKYLSEYAELRRKQKKEKRIIHKGDFNSVDAVKERIEEYHSTAWSRASEWYLKE